MKYKMSSNVAIRSSNYSAAVAFYSQVLGFKDRSQTADYTDLDAAPLTMFIIPDDEVSGLVMELMVENLEDAKAHLLENGCEIIRWGGKGQDCYIKDPFGVVFNVWEQPDMKG